MACVLKCLRCMSKSTNHHVHYIGVRVRVCTDNTLGSNWVKCATSASLGSLDVNLEANAKGTMDLVDVRDGVSELAGFAHDDVAMVLHKLCCKYLLNI